jgi:signal transduction histidine kinase
LVVLVTGWGAWRDLSEVRRTILGNEISRLRSHAKRTVGRIENYLEERPSERGITSLRDADWLRAFWLRVVPRERQRLYAALVTDDGVVVMHSDRSHQGQRLERQWFERRVREAGDDVVETQSAILTLGTAAYDIQVPIEVNDTEIGAYHSGFDVAWLDEAVADRRRALYGRWALMGGLIVGIVLAAGFSLFHLARRTAALQHALGMARTQQLAELGRLAGVLAHEVRNPLNALRLNLHALERSDRNDRALSPSERSGVLKESKAEIDRLEELIRNILGYARPGEARIVDVDLRHELDATVSFIGQLIERENTGLRIQLPDREVLVHMDRDRFRQMMLNLLNNARDAVDKNGEISITLRTRDGWAHIVVDDSGPGIPPSHRDRIFEPFFTTKERGCGLGLALVKRFAEEAGGTVACEHDVDRGARFRICLPEARHPRVGHEESTL